MKKVLFIPLTVLAGAMALGYASNHKAYQEVKAIPEPVTYIEMKPSAFSDYEEGKGSFANSDATFWGEGYSFNALDTFFRGETAEGWTGELSLVPWRQYTQYIYFQWGGANPEDNLMQLEFHYGTYTKTICNPTFVENPMLLTYFKIPDEEFATLDHDNGFDMFIRFIDNRSAGYGFHNFGYLHVNQSEEQVGDAMRYFLNHINMSDNRDWKVNNNRAIYNHYYTNDDLKAVFYKTVDSVDEDFEDNDLFLNHWYLDLNYGNTPNDARHVDNILSNLSVRLDGNSNMQYNQTGAKYFSGWYQNGQGYIASDTPRYRFVSRPFVLEGNGLVSIKMAGRAASLHVIDTEKKEDLAWADLRSFSTEGNENEQYLGFNTVTMVRHYINLSEYVGKTIQLALADVEEEGWAASYFDELITKYETYPAFGIDVLYQENDVVRSYNYHFDKYIASTHIDNDPNGLKYNASKEDVTVVDNSPMYSAYKFLTNYYNLLRSPANEFSFDKASDDVKKQIANEYRLLSADAKAIVDESKDLQIVGDFDAEWYKRMPSATNKISSVINELQPYETYTVSFSANGGEGQMASINDVRGDFILPENEFTAPEGRVFNGWKVNNTGDTLMPNQTINITSDVEIVAQWKEIPALTFTVSFYANGGTGNMDEIPNQFDNYVLPENGFTAPAGYHFVGWKIDGQDELLQPGATIEITADVILVAQWEVTKFTITFNANGGTGTMADLVKNEGDMYELPESAFTAPDNHNFVGWKVNGAGQTLQPGATIEITADIELVAQWEQIVICSVSFNANGGTGTMSSMQVEKGHQITLPACTFVAPAGKEFKGWNVKRDLYQPGDNVIITSDTEIFAEWKLVQVIEETYTVSFSANGGTGTMSEVTDVVGNYTLPNCSFVAPEGQEFAGWLVGNQLYQPGQNINVNGNVTVVAQWKDIETVIPSSSEPTSSEPIEQNSEPTSEPNGQGSEEEPAKKGCGGSIVSVSTILSVISLAAVPFLLTRKKNEK